MAERLHPGVYVEEISGGVRPIEGVSTSTAAFVGATPRGVPDAAHFCTSFDDFVRAVGGHAQAELGHMAAAAEAFFMGGGRRLYAVRVLPSDATVGTSGDIESRGSDTAPPSIAIHARGKGVWSDALRLFISDATHFPNDAFKLEVKWTEAGATKTLETFDDMRMDPEHEEYFARAINERSRYIKVEDKFAQYVDDPDADTTPLAERNAYVRSTKLGTNEKYKIYDGAELSLRWWDAATDVSDEATLTVNSTTAAGAVFDEDGVAEITPAALRDLLNTLGTKFRAVLLTRQVELQAGTALPGTITIAAPAGTSFNLAGQTLTLNIAGTPTDMVVNTLLGATPAATVSPAQLASLINDNVDGATATARPDGSVVVRTAPDTAGAIPALTCAPTASSISTVATTGGAGKVVESPEGLRIAITEKIDPFKRRSQLKAWGLAATARGYAENSPSNPDARPVVSLTALRLGGGTDGTEEISVSDFQGDEGERTGLHALDRSDVNLIAFPGQNTPEYIAAGIAYADWRGTCFFIADGPGDADLDAEIVASDAAMFVEGLPSKSENSAIFYPWIRVSDPLGSGRNPTRFVPPSGHVAGVFARTDVSRGVWKAPAGLEATIPGALGLQYTMTDAEQDICNPIGLNALRQFPNAGIIVWGSRTLANDPEWRYVPVRRMALFLKESLRRGMQWAVFEPNDQDLWDKIRLNIQAFMMSLFRQGALQGATPNEAFLVQCDRSTNPQELVDLGIVTARVAFAPLKPAEFVVIQVQQKALVTA